MKDGRQHFLALSKSDDTQCMKYDSQPGELLSIDYRKFFLTALNYFVLLTIQLLNWKKLLAKTRNGSAVITSLPVQVVPFPVKPLKHVHR